MTFERRARPRYPLEAVVLFEHREKGQGTVSGYGRILNLSSSGVFFEPEGPAPIGGRLELSIHWPVALENGCPLQLKIDGTIIRCSQRGVAVRIERYEFRTRAARTAAAT
jgi:PilZ domain